MIENESLDEELLVVETVTRYRTVDGKEFSSLSVAEGQAKRIFNVAKANRLLDAGATVAEAARVAGFHVPPSSLLEKITKDTPLIISHWQCQNTPGYRVTRINDDLTFFVYGNAGSWDGSYGSDVSRVALDRYVEQTLTAQRV